MLRLSRCGIRAWWEWIGEVVCRGRLFDGLASMRDKIMIQRGYDGVVAEGIEEYWGAVGIREIYPYYRG
jgi:hypothetical protein